MWTSVENALSPQPVVSKTGRDRVENDCGQMCTNAGYATARRASFLTKKMSVFRHLS